MQAKGTKSTSCVRNEMDLVPLACEDGRHAYGLDIILRLFSVTFRHYYYQHMKTVGTL